MVYKKELIELLYQKSFKYSEEPIYKLVSGKMSNFYINCKPVTLSAEGLFLISDIIYYYSIANTYITAIGGLTFGADPISVAVSQFSYNKSPVVNAFSIRKTKKDYGTSVWIEGDVSPGEHVAIVDDVATTGGSTIKAIERAREEGLIVDKIIILVDRQEGGIKNIEQYVEQVDVIITRDDLIAFHNTSNNI